MQVLHCFSDQPFDLFHGLTGRMLAGIQSDTSFGLLGLVPLRLRSLAGYCALFEHQSGLERFVRFLETFCSAVTWRVKEYDLPPTEFDRPIIILGAPRSGTTVVFETLSICPNVWTIGGESHRVGLAIARSIIVDKHDGTLTFECEVGRGTTFVISLPIRSSKEIRLAGTDGGPSGPHC